MHQSKEDRPAPRFYTRDQIAPNMPIKVRDSQDFTFFGVTKTKAGDAPISIAFKIIKQNGEQFLFHYHELLSPLRFDGNSQIVLSTTTVKITIQGKNLEQLFDYLAEHRLVWMKEPDSEFMEVKENKPEISAIVVEEEG